MYNRYVKQARNRHIPFELSKDIFTSIVLSTHCRYCCEESSQFSYGIKVIGIDRCDSNKGYTIDNCVPCCKYCNALKGTKSEEEFFEYTTKIMTGEIKLSNNHKTNKHWQYEQRNVLL